MAKVFDVINDDIQGFISRQHMFFVATAPLAGDGHINLSPKGMDCLRVLSPTRVAYLDMTGSGNETSAHIAENGRITFMFCAFEGPADIIRLYGTGRTILPGTPEWEDLVGNFTVYPGTRQVILADIDRVQTSCGWGVPLMDYKADRDTLLKYWEVKGDELSEHHRLKNTASMDGLPTPLCEMFSQPEQS